ncbi:MAG TPA: hypothetical protein RMH85_28105 [Polyangiaceae bacterium LLY-WYZ-15_(1-7)]|nr:hypothetical protein [Polyangiaceae bacterium LLY-WYZ-15_(1-7)]HJL00522.1 hypothetical protein [Polyangiaceae bacterium LLY-WYZ-15_(1-7)]HJL12376.1 hypothetical protein [Polyangiaceae bacterium LLY-WYZ-15_(1-7)]HJL30588.1 hypothetical protein [Polyangiaceae bacterium LLY-WYZ-15_(1-7)]HJL50052.1 hypothetical protein [Polyangiaceae bacterium LLY-WYZ-15_(1-7)]
MMTRPLLALVLAASGLSTCEDEAPPVPQHADYESEEGLDEPVGDVPGMVVDSSETN